MKKAVVIIAGVAAYAVIKVGSKVVMYEVNKPKGQGAVILNNAFSTIIGTVGASAVMQAVQDGLNS